MMEIVANCTIVAVKLQMINQNRKYPLQNLKNIGLELTGEIAENHAILVDHF